MILIFRFKHKLQNLKIFVDIVDVKEYIISKEEGTSPTPERTLHNMTKIYRIWEAFDNGEMSLRLETENKEYAEGIFPTKKDVINELKQERRNGAYMRPTDSFTYYLEEVERLTDDDDMGIGETIREVTATWEDALNYDEDEEESE